MSKLLYITSVIWHTWIFECTSGRGGTTVIAGDRNIDFTEYTVTRRIGSIIKLTVVVTHG